MQRFLPLSFKLTVALSVLALVIVSALGVWQLRAEERDLRNTVTRNTRLLGRSLQIAFENALRDRQEADVAETLKALDRIAPDIDIFVYDEHGRLLAASEAARVNQSFPASALVNNGLRFEYTPRGERAVLYLPLRITRMERQATFVMVRPLDALHRDLDATRMRVTFTLIAFVFAVGLVTMFLSRFWVGKPLGDVVAHMRRVRAGDLSSQPLKIHDDEVGQTLREFDVLVRNLRETRERLELEAERRRRLEEGMRHVDKLATVGQLAAGVAHEIGSPLQVLEGRIAGLEGKADNPDEVKRISRLLLEHTQRITRIVSRLTGLARRRSLPMQGADVAHGARMVVELLEGEARRRGVSIHLEIQPNLSSVSADADQLQQVVLNLVRNALDAAPQGGHVRVFVQNATRSDVGPERAVLRIMVQDDGPGMDEQTRTRAFEPFFTTRSQEGGTGLGLAVVKGIVDDHDGHIELTSAPGQGACFTIDLPIEPSGDRDAERTLFK